jgi:segregation and condensation protein B
VDSIGTEQIQNIIEILNEEYHKEGRCFHIIEVAGGYQFATRPQYATWIRKLYRGRRLPRLSPAALETLAIIAFKGPIIRAEIEAVRGVNVEGVLKTLLERNLITVVGREEAPGRPLLYGTTQDFLVYFGLNSLADLPKPRELEELLDREQDSTETQEVAVPTEELYASQ